MNITGYFYCEVCKRNLSKNVLAAYGLEERIFNCPSCAATYKYDVKMSRTGDRNFTIVKLEKLQLTVIALLSNPRNPSDGFVPIPIVVPIKNKPMPGITPFDGMDDYLNLSEVTFGEIVGSKYSTVYGVGTLPRLLSVIPEEFYYQLGHVKTVKLFDILRDASGLLAQWVKTTIKENDLKLEMSAGASLAFSVLPLSPYLANYIDALLGDDIAVVYEEGVLLGLKHKDVLLRLCPISAPGQTVLENARMIATDHRDYLAKLRKILNKNKEPKK